MLHFQNTNILVPLKEKGYTYIDLANGDFLTWFPVLFKSIREKALTLVDIVLIFVK